MSALPYYIGCPVWICDAWVGSVYASKSRDRWLADYTRAFNSVEGNSTFYALPTADTVRRWVDESADGFRFLFKFPRSITHDRELLAAEQETDAFLSLLDILRQAGRLGPSMVQLGPSFDGHKLSQLEAFLARLPREFPYAVEVRHADYFDEGANEQTLDAMLAEYRVERVLFDSRPLFSSPPTDELEVKSQSRKPNVPVRQTVTNQSPIVRFVGRNDLATTTRWVDEWASILADWIARGLTPYFFAHAPNNAFAPPLATMLHKRLAEYVPTLPPLPTWPGSEVQKQRELF